ncbi:MAG: type II toxin-antitoxin system VapC family toxin [Mycobacterium sp.]
MIYLDTSAMVKLVVVEPESAVLIDWLNEHDDTPLATSVIGHIELLRAAMRAGPTVTAGARRLLDSVDGLILTDEIVEQAGALAPPELRTLDAVHLATALVYRRSITALCAYDNRLLSAARAYGLTVSSPMS